MTRPLTPRQAEVAVLVAEGLSNGEIAGRLGVTRDTAMKHVSALLIKTNTGRRMDAVVALGYLVHGHVHVFRCACGEVAS